MVKGSISLCFILLYEQVHDNVSVSAMFIITYYVNIYAMRRATILSGCRVIVRVVSHF